VTGGAGERVQPWRGEGWAPCDADAGSEIVTCRSEGIGDAVVAGKYEALWRAGEDLRLLALDQGLKLVEFFAPGTDAIPADAVVDGEVAGGLPTVLGKGGGVEVAVVEAAGLALGVAG